MVETRRGKNGFVISSCLLPLPPRFDSEPASVGALQEKQTLPFKSCWYPSLPLLQATPFPASPLQRELFFPEQFLHFPCCHIPHTVCVCVRIVHTYLFTCVSNMFVQPLPAKLPFRRNNGRLSSQRNIWILIWVKKLSGGVERLRWGGKELTRQIVLCLAFCISNKAEGETETV